MRTLSEALRETTTLQAAEIEWLHLVVGDWQLIADLSFSDLLLWVRGGAEGRWTAVAHVRPNTGPMVFHDDVVGRSGTASRITMLDEAARSGRVVSGRAPRYDDDMVVREMAVPVACRGSIIAVISRHTNIASGRTPSRLELTYQSVADSLCRMLAAGDFPSAAEPTGLRRGAPRVGDGVITLDASGRTKYASPNAVSAIHRLGYHGDVIGEVFAQLVADLLTSGGDSVDESLALVVTGRAPWRSEVATRSATVSMRAIPLIEAGRRVGALLLVREISELRRREQELMSKDATIREIHHRVKNNLQTVAALLRLQVRRLDDPQAKLALQQAVRRVSTIASVHESLSLGFEETVDFDDVALRGLQGVVEVATSEHPVQHRFTGSFGRLRAEDATSIALITSELVQNAVEHGLAQHGGTVEVRGERSLDEDGTDLLTVTITDDGEGLPPGLRPDRAGLGTRIVTSMVSDLGGKIRWHSPPEGGTIVTFTARLRPLQRS